MNTRLQNYTRRIEVQQEKKCLLSLREIRFPIPSKRAEASYVTLVTACCGCRPLQGFSSRWRSPFTPF